MWTRRGKCEQGGVNVNSELWAGLIPVWTRFWKCAWGQQNVNIADSDKSRGCVHNMIKETILSGVGREKACCWWFAYRTNSLISQAWYHRVIVAMWGLSRATALSLTGRTQRWRSTVRVITLLSRFSNWRRQLDISTMPRWASTLTGSISTVSRVLLFLPSNWVLELWVNGATWVYSGDLC